MVWTNTVLNDFLIDFNPEKKKEMRFDSVQNNFSNCFIFLFVHIFIIFWENVFKGEKKKQIKMHFSMQESNRQPAFLLKEKIQTKDRKNGIEF